MRNQSQVRIEKTPIVKQPEKLDALLESIRDDARSLSRTYLKQTIVPEGGE